MPPVGMAIVGLFAKNNMKIKLLVLGAIGLSSLVFYLYKKTKAFKIIPQPSKENERHHLTNIFSKAKKLAIGN